MPDAAKSIAVPRLVTMQKLGCMYHRKESRYSIKYVEKELLVIIECLECKPPTEIVRFKITRGEV